MGTLEKPIAANPPARLCGATAQPPPRGSTRARWRPLVFRLAAVTLSLVPLVVVEVLLVAFDIADPARSGDPFVGFHAIRPLFVKTENGDRYEIAPSRRTHFANDSFDVQKSPDEFRVFCIGDSTVQGNPWSIETSFSTFLELSLSAADPSRRWQVVNCGGISYASYRMIPIIEEVLAYEPDLLIVHASHNEFLEDRTYPLVKQLPRQITWMQKNLASLRIYNLSFSAIAALKGRAKTIPRSRVDLAVEVEALLDYRGGLEHYHRDDDWRLGVIAHYEFNLRRIVAIARQSGVPLILMNPVSNLRDSPPFKSEHRSDLDIEQINQCVTLWNEARRYYATDRSRVLKLLHQAVAIDDQHAGLRYDLAKCLDSMGLFGEAKREYIAAKELDVCPLRILEPMSRIVQSVAQDTATPLVDVRRLFEQLSRNQIVGGDWLVDHVHPSMSGYQKVADALADTMVTLRLIRPADDWFAVRDRRYLEHVRSLDALYFAKGQAHLEGLMNWAQGRVTRERATDPDSHQRHPPTPQ